MSTQSDGAHVAAGTRVSRIAQNLAALLRLRLTQVRQDARQTGRRLMMGVVLAVIALIIALMALPLLVATAILILAQYMPAWLAAAIVLVTTLVIAAILLLVARRKLRWTGVTLPQDLQADWQAIRERLEEGR